MKPIKLFAVFIFISISIKLNAQSGDPLARKIDTLSRKIDTVSKNLAATSRKIDRASRKVDTTLKLENLELSHAPAFSLLDISPSIITRPASTRALTTSVVSNLRSGIPQNYALEVTPFWFSKHPELTSAKYFGFDATDTANIKNLEWSRAKYYSLSLAVINKDTSINVGTLGNHNVSFGVRTTLLKFYRKSDLKNIYNKNNAWLRGLSDAQPSTGPLPRTELDEFQQNTQALVDSVRESLKALPLFSLDFAFASNMTFDNNSISSNRINRTGFWLTANLNAPLSPKGSNDNYLKFYLIGRYINSKDSLDLQKNYINANLWDFGGRVEFQFHRVSFGYEYIERSSSVDAFSSYRSVGLLQFQVSDNLFISGSFGKNFPKGNNIISALGLNWGISSGRESIVQKPTL
ncbi:hypothetical protein HRG84_13435 [Flavisolibacter sp. BT320]|nr:hypothetical protein [Flavisolibacter longurius]